MSYIKQEASDDRDGFPGDHNPQSSQNPITAFLAKLWALVNDPSCDDLIAWDPTGASFHVYDQSRFAREVLPRYFKHNNFASFIRQLNMYGFRKLSTIEHGSLNNERDDIEFAHPSFLRGQESLLESIKRRAPETQQKSNLPGSYLDLKTGRPIELSQILDDVRNLKNKQTSVNDKLSYMQTEHEALWSEIGSLRQKHAKQQLIVSKLMEFLVRFLSSNSAHGHEQSVGQQMPKEGITADLLHSGQEQAHYPQSHEQNLSPNTLKRKHAAITHVNDGPNKRTAGQQSFSYPPGGLGRQQSVTINELTDNDPGTWLHANASPLVDLVPSPPPTQSADDNHPQQKNDYRWPTSTNEEQHQTGHEQRDPRQPTAAFRAPGTADNAANTYVPDFILRTDDPNLGQINGGKPTGVTTSTVQPTMSVPSAPLVNQGQAELPNPTDNSKESPHLFVHSKIDPLTGQLSFSLDDITGDVDHIQSSLDNIRDFMFENLPEGATIDDLFGDENGLFSPLLQAATSENNNSAGNIFLENAQDQKLHSADHVVNPHESLGNSQSVPNVNNQLLEQLINEKSLVEEQRHTIDQLARDNSNLEHRVHLLEQQATQRK